MAGNVITSFILITSILLHAHFADESYSAVMPHTVTALTGSCVQIPCTFNISDFEDKRNGTKLHGIWLKKIPQYANKDSFVAFNSSENIIRGFSDIQMTGDLTERNCTTVFYNIMKNHSDPYYFRLETVPDVFRATFNTNKDDSKDSSKTVTIAVRDSPPAPELKFSSQSCVMEETTVNLRCSAEAPCPEQPPKISWTYIPQSAHITKQLHENPDKTQSMFSIMTFKASYKDHKKNISCTVTYPRNTLNNSTVETTITLKVLFPPKETHITIDPSASVSVGANVTLVCNSKTSPSNETNYTWYKRGQEMPLFLEKKMNFIVTHDKTGLYFCIAKNKYGNQSSEDIQIPFEGQSGFPPLVIYGCTGGLLALVLSSTLLFYCMRTKRSRQAHVTGRDQATDVNRDTVAIYANKDIVISKKSEKKEIDELHYGEIDFSKSETGQMISECSNNDPQTVYAGIRVTERNK